MSKTDKKTDVVPVETVEPERIEVTPVGYMGPAPFFIATGDTQDYIIDEIIEQGFQLAYVLGEIEKSEKVGNATKKWRQVQLFKIINVFAGRAIIPVDTAHESLGEITPGAIYSLPVIPKTLTDKVNHFFRAVHEKHDCESVVILTYDPKFKDTEEASKGWGVLIPSQENTPASCDYEPSSVQGDQREGTYIVGSIHSHPEMSAYCSNTDMKDQTQFPGVHITFGWEKGSPINEYHCELQMGEKGYSLAEEHVFEAKVFEHDPDVVEWLKKVKKYKPKPVQKAAPVTPTQKNFTYSNYKQSYDGLPKYYPTPSQVTLIVHLENFVSETDVCPTCLKVLSEHSKTKYRCVHCQSFLMDADMSVEDLVSIRKDILSFETYELNMSNTKGRKDIFIWERSLVINDKGDPEVENFIYLHHEGDPSLRRFSEDDYQIAIDFSLNPEEYSDKSSKDSPPLP